MEYLSRDINPYIQRLCDTVKELKCNILYLGKLSRYTNFFCYYMAYLSAVKKIMAHKLLTHQSDDAEKSLVSVEFISQAKLSKIIKN